MSQSYVISDLHYFSQRSVLPTYWSSICKALEQSKHFVLNGDIFDFRWSTVGDFAETARKAKTWLSNLMQQAPQCEFHYILGNHDSLPLFVETLSELAEETPNLSVHKTCFRLGNNIFLHGDIYGNNMNAADLIAYRENFHRAASKPRGSAANALYSLFVATQLHHLPRMLIPRDVICRRILEFLGNTVPEYLNEPTHIYFGHTHNPFEAYHYRDHYFYNTGSTIKYMKFNMLSFA